MPAVSAGLTAGYVGLHWPYETDGRPFGMCPKRDAQRGRATGRSTTRRSVRWKMYCSRWSAVFVFVREDLPILRVPDLIAGRSLDGAPAHEPGRVAHRSRHALPPHVEAERLAPARRSRLRHCAHPGVQRVRFAREPGQHEIDRDRRDSKRLDQGCDCGIRGGGARRAGRPAGVAGAAVEPVEAELAVSLAELAATALQPAPGLMP